MAYAVRHCCILRCTSFLHLIHTLVFSPTCFGAFPAPSSGTFNVSIHTQHTVMSGSSHLALCSIPFKTGLCLRVSLVFECWQSHYSVYIFMLRLKYTLKVNLKYFRTLHTSCRYLDYSMCCKKYLKPRCFYVHIRCFMQFVHFLVDFRASSPDFGFCQLFSVSTTYVRSPDVCVQLVLQLIFRTTECIRSIKINPPCTIIGARLRISLFCSGM